MVCLREFAVADRELDPALDQPQQRRAQVGDLVDDLSLLPQQDVDHPVEQCHQHCGLAVEVPAYGRPGDPAVAPMSVIDTA
jgi:hypothetical protein